MYTETTHITQLNPSSSVHPLGVRWSPSLNFAAAYAATATEQLRPRGFMMSDIPQFLAIADERSIAHTTIEARDYCTAPCAERWAASHAAGWEAHRALRWAITRPDDDRLVGYARLRDIDLDMGIRMCRERLLRQYIWYRDEFEDVIAWAVMKTKTEWLGSLSGMAARLGLKCVNQPSELDSDTAA